MEGDARVPSSRREEAGRAAHGPRALRVLTLSAWSSFFSKDVTFAIAAMYMLREPLPRSFPLRARTDVQSVVGRADVRGGSSAAACVPGSETHMAVCVWTVTAPRK